MSIGGWALDQIPFVGDELSDKYDSAIDDFSDSINRYKAAETGPYGGVDRNNFTLRGFDGRNNRLQNQMAGVSQRVAPQAQDSAYRAYQDFGLNELRNRAMGKNSIAELQARQMADRNIAQQQGLAAGARPNQSALMARTAAQNIGRINAGVAGQSALARAMEAQQALGQLGGLSSQARGQDIGLNQFNAEQQLRNRQINDNAYLGLSDQDLRNAGLQQQGTMGYEQERGRRYGYQLGTPTVGEQALTAGAQLGGYLMGMG